MQSRRASGRASIPVDEAGEYSPGLHIETRWRPSLVHTTITWCGAHPAIRMRRHAIDGLRIETWWHRHVYQAWLIEPRLDAYQSERWLSTRPPLAWTIRHGDASCARRLSKTSRTLTSGLALSPWSTRQRQKQSVYEQADRKGHDRLAECTTGLTEQDDGSRYKDRRQHSDCTA